LAFISFKSYSSNAPQKCEDIINKMFSAAKAVHTLHTNVATLERVSGKNKLLKYAVKLNISPYKAYSKNLDDGSEVLFVQGQNNNEATINPNGFPYVNLHLDPYGKLMRKGQHQTFLWLGFNHISDILSHSLAKYPDAYTKFVKRDADTVFNKDSCYKIEINFSNYTYVKYTVTQKGETITSIAAKNYLSEYEILIHNDVSWFTDELEIGKQLILPSAYAKSTTLLIRKDNFLPVDVRIYDDAGFFEEYIYTKLQLNPTIPDAEFTESYSGYHF